MCLPSPALAVLDRDSWVADMLCLEGVREKIFMLVTCCRAMCVLCVCFCGGGWLPCCYGVRLVVFGSAWLVQIGTALRTRKMWRFFVGPKSGRSGGFPLQY